MGEGRRERTGREVTGLGTLRAALWLLHTLTQGTPLRSTRYCTCSFPTSHDSGLPDFVNAISPACTGSVINLSKPYLGHHPPSSLWQPQAPGLMPSSLCQPQWKWSQSQVSWMSLCLSFSRGLNSPGGHGFSLSPLHPSPSSGPDTWP